MKTNKTELNKARQYLIDEFVESLDGEKYIWEQDWNVSYKNFVNATTNSNYKGINSIILLLSALKNGFKDNRWCSFKQATAKGWKIKKDSKGTPVEFWSVYDKTNKKNISIYDYNDLIKIDKRDPEEFRMIDKVYTVFNGDQLEGIPELPEDEIKLNDIQMNAFINNIKTNMQVKYAEEGDKAYYMPSNDIVVMPPRGTFKTQEGFDTTLLHELAHATGHASRLDRKLANSFGTKEYAIEELHAEMSAVFMRQYLDLEIDENHLKNHKAYIQSWAHSIKEDPKVLFKAIKEAEKIADYLIDKGELELVQA